MKKRTVIHTNKAPAAIGPYSQAVAYGDMVFCAGQIPLDPVGGVLIEGDISKQAARVIANLKAVLEESGSGLDRILRLEVYMTDLGNFPAVNEYLATVFPEDPPARLTVEVARLPMEAEIEIAAIAVVSSS